MSLTDWEDLFGHKHAVHALLCLHAANGHPQRWTDVSNSMSQRLGFWVDPQAVNRALTALRQQGLVERVNSDGGSRRNRRYTLTQRGVDLAGQVNDMFGHLDQRLASNPTEHPQAGSVRGHRRSLGVDKQFG